MNDLLESLINDFNDHDYAHAYMESHAVSRIAAQLYALRKQRGWSQEFLSTQSGIAQETISKIESADFSSITMKTLHKFSRAFDVDLRIAFESFSKGIMDVINLKSENLKVPPRTDDIRKFKSKTIHTGFDGDWQALEDSDFLNVKIVYAPHTEHVELTHQTGEWQELVALNMCAGAC